MTITFNRRNLLLTAGATAVALSAGHSFAQGTLPPAPVPAQWAKSPELYHVRLSPDGGSIAFIHELNGDHFLRVVTVADGKFKEFNIGKVDVTALDFVDASHLVVTSLGHDMLSNDHYRHSIGSIYDIAKGSVEPLFQNIPDFGGELSTPVSIVTVNGKRQVVAGSFKATPEDFQYLYRFDVDGKGTLLDRGPGETIEWLTAADGAPVARHSYIQRTRQWILEYRQGGSWKTIATGKFEYDLPELIGLAADGASIIVSKYDDAGEARYYTVSPDGAVSAPLPFTADSATILFDPVTRRMIGHSVNGDRPTYVFDDPVMAAVVTKAEKAVPGYRMEIVARADDPNRVIIRSEGDDDAGTYYFIDFAKGQSMVIGESFSSVAPEWIGARTAIHYKTADGFDISAILTLPANVEAKNLPLVVMAHGPDVRATLAFDSGIAAPGQAYAAGFLAQAFAAAGFAVLQPNMRGSSGYGAAFRRAGFGEYGHRMLSDLADGVTALTSQGTVNPKRVAIAGAFSGGYTALASMTSLPGTYACAVDIEGTSDLRTFLERKRNFNTADTNLPYRYWQRWLGDISALDSLSPLKSAAKVQAPILIIHGADDQSVPPAQSKDMVAALKAAGKDVTFVQQDWNLTEAQRMAITPVIVEFVKAHTA